MQILISQRMQDVQECFKALSENTTLLDTCEKIAKVIIETLKQGNRVYFFGNGGSAADAQHLAAEFMGRFKFDREPLPAMSLNTNVSVLTAVGNDYGYDNVFSRQVKGLVKKGDVCVGLSTSGNSSNVLKAIEEANKQGAVTIAITGCKNCSLKEKAFIHLPVPSEDTARIQEMTIFMGHVICEIVEKEIFGADS